MIIAVQVQEPDGTWHTLNRQRASQSTLRQVREELALLMDRWRFYFSGATRLRLHEIDW